MALKNSATKEILSHLDKYPGEDIYFSPDGLTSVPRGMALIYPNGASNQTTGMKALFDPRQKNRELQMFQ